LEIVLYVIALQLKDLYGLEDPLDVYNQNVKIIIMARLRRVRDGEMEEGAMSDAISWESGKPEVVGHRPIVGCAMQVGSITARSYSNRDWWLTTEVTEILEERIEGDLLYVKFTTKNSVYEWWGGDTSLAMQMLRDIKNEKRKTKGTD